MKSTFEELFDYLALSSPRAEVRDADLIVGFGHFDSKIPMTCCELYRRGVAARILFTGGVGAGTADLEMPEAEFFKQVARRECPDVPPEAILTESRSSNTSENLRFGQEILQRVCPEASFTRGIRRVALVANAYRQRRVWLTMRKIYPQLEGINCPPPTDYHLEKELFADKGQDLDSLLLGELQRVAEYPGRGFIEPCEIPPEFC